MSPRPEGPRWDRLLPACALVVLAASLALAWTAARALEDRHLLAVEGRLSLLAHSLERDLRETPPDKASLVLGGLLAEEGDLLRGLTLEGPPNLAAGDPGAAADRRFDLFLGPRWRGSGGGRGSHGRGRRVLTVALAPEALRPPWVTRLLIPAAAAGGVLLLALAVLGGRLLLRQQEEERRAGERRRLEGLSRAGAGLAHQLRTPLATIKGSCQLLLEDDTGLAGEASRRRLASVLTQCERMDHLLADLLDYARPPAPEPVARPVAEALEDLRELSPRVTVGSGPTDIVWSDPEHLRHILTNLVTNALECSPAETPVEVSSQTLDGEVEIRVADCGPGPGDDPEHLFEPYVTTRASGTGLGLPLARALARANGGSLRLEARLGGGAQAVVRLPRPPHGGKGAP